MAQKIVRIVTSDEIHESIRLKTLALGRVRFDMDDYINAIEKLGSRNCRSKQNRVGSSPMVVIL